jgi:HAD superfamily hydrolase (TIGR01549 family)
MERWVCLDVGETLIDETRIWGAWADELDVPRLTFFAALGAVIAEGLEHGEVFSRFGLPSDTWQRRRASVERRHGGFREVDLYPDALPAIAALRARGYRIAVIANQPAVRHAQLTALGVAPDVMAMSEELGVHKPDPAFFARSLELMGVADPGTVTYVGDRVDNDVVPSIAAGLRAAWIRRGPWGRIQGLPDGVRPALEVGSLSELEERIGEAWRD